MLPEAIKRSNAFRIISAIAMTIPAWAQPFRINQVR